MAYAAYRYPPGNYSDCGRTTFEVLDITVALVDACRLRRELACCDDVGVLRCEPLLHRSPACDHDGRRARLTVRFSTAHYADVLRCVLGCVPDGEIGPRLTWRAHLERRGYSCEQWDNSHPEVASTLQRFMGPHPP